MKRLFAVICLFIWMPIPAMGGWFGPSNYEECILKNMKGVTSDKAVRAIAKACRAKFPRKVGEEYYDVPMSVLKSKNPRPLDGALVCPYKGLLQTEYNDRPSD